MTPVFAYIRVSTQKQSAQGSSLIEQRAAIEAYVKKNDLTVLEWFEETETAAKRGRPTFTRLMRALLKDEAKGVVIHKIDRSARNLRDWADLGDLIDKGVAVHFAHESLDMHSRGGRLAADIQAVVAADFIRNLKDEVRKGFYGRLKQGLYPLQAPIGYVDMGGGNAKTVDPIQGPLVRQAFELYATGEFNFHTLLEEMKRLGLRGRKGAPISLGGLTTILNSPFYIGLIHLKKTGETFQGVHPPLIRKELYDRVQRVLRGNRLAGAAWTHEFLFRRLIRCAHCGRVLIGERQKQRYVYYRCHDPKCGSVSLSEATVERYVLSLFELIRVDEKDELEDLRDMVDVLRGTAKTDRARQEQALQLQIANSTERLGRLTDMLVDGVVDKEMFEVKKLELLANRRSLQDQLETIDQAPSKADRVDGYLELANTAYLRFKTGLAAEKRDMVARVTSNFIGDGNSPAITLRTPLQEIADYEKLQCCAPHRDNRRTRVMKIYAMLSRAAEAAEQSANDNLRAEREKRAA